MIWRRFWSLSRLSLIHISFGPEKLAENFNVLINAIVKAKPAAAKGTYLRSVTVASTMGPGIKIAANRLEN